MTQKTTIGLISAGTAFIITAGGAIGIAFVATGGKTPNAGALISSLVLGLVAAAKDLRSLFKLPPVNGVNGNGGTEVQTRQGVKLE